MVITPSDAYIKNTEEFTRILGIAVETAKNQDKLVTIGINPEFPATGYGYIKYDKNQTENYKTVEEFKEKPDYDTALEYVESGNYVWNSGMFIWKASVILDKFKEYIPDIYDDLNNIGNAMGTEKEAEVINEIYPQIRKISVDYAIMEPSAAKGDVMVVPGEFGWNDVGSWDMMKVLHNENEEGNIIVGDGTVIDTTNTVVYSSGRYVAVVGVDNLVVVETEDAVMVCNKDKAQDVKKIVDSLTEQDRKELL